jgi:hypothetical protein
MLDIFRNHDQHFLQLSTIGAAVAVVQVKHVVVVISVAVVAREHEQNQFKKKIFPPEPKKNCLFLNYPL